LVKKLMGKLPEWTRSPQRVPMENVALSACDCTTRRDARETKGLGYRAATAASRCCDGGDCC